VTRRVPLPGAAELFRPTSLPSPVPEPPVSSAVTSSGGTPRRKHEAKITVYLSDEELLALEHARLALRAAHGIAVDRGRIVREAIGTLLADFAARGVDSQLVRGLLGESGS
jgi:hypothetical protein